jgi:iron complex outermembrane receptor protein
MRGIALIVLVLGCLKGVAQVEISNNIYAVESAGAASKGSIAGHVNTTDNHPAAFVTVEVKGTNKLTATDENGNFIIRGLKEGSYTLEISMVGLRTQNKTVEVKSSETTTVAITIEEDAKQLEAVIVTTSKNVNHQPLTVGKVAIDPMDLPQSVAVVGQALIKDQQAMRLSDVIKNVNGVYLSSTRGNSQEYFSGRGYAFGNNNYFKNGARINFGAMPEMSGLERVEILKGSSAILFGQVAPGAVINMVTKQPKFNFGGEVSMRAGSYDLYKPAIDIYGPISSSVAYRVNGTYESANSYRDQVKSKRYYVNPSFLFKLGKRTELVVEGDYLNHEYTPDFGIGTVDNTIIPDVPRSKFLGTPWQYATTQQSTASASVKHELNDAWKLNASLSYQFYKRDYYAVERVQALANGDWTRPLGRTLTDENYYTGQVNLTGKFKSGSLDHTLLTGIDADRYLTTAYAFSFPAVAGLAAGSYDKINIFDLNKYAQRTDIPEATRIRKTEAPVNRFGAYVQDLVKISEKLNLLAGIRWSYVQTMGIDSANLLNPAASTKGQNRYDKAFSPRVGIVYKPLKTTALFASYSNSFSVNTGVDISGNSVAPSIIDQFELGIKNDLFKGLLTANVTAYRIINNNLAQMAPFLANGNVNSDANIKVLSGQTTSDGVELDISSHPVKGLDINAGYSHTFIRYTKTSPEKGSFVTGEQIIGNPEHNANASAFYTFNSTSLKGLKLGVAGFYTGDRFGGFNNTIGQAQTYSRIFSVNGFTTVDVSAGYTFKKVSLLAKVSNVTNTLNYYVHENYSINPIPPTQLIATVSYKF